MHGPRWWNPTPPHRRHRRCHGNGCVYVQRFVVVLTLWWIFGSLDSLVSNTGREGLARSARSTPLVAAQRTNNDDTSSTTGVYSTSCDGRMQPRPGAIYSAVGHLNYGVGLELRADMSIPGGCEVNLPIEVSRAMYATRHISFASLSCGCRIDCEVR